MTIFQNVTRGSLVRGSGLLAIVAGSTGVYLTRWGMFGFVLTGIPLWCFGVVAAAGGVMFFLGPMVYGAGSVDPAAVSPGGPERPLFLYLRPFELDARSVMQLLVGASAGVLVYLNLLDGAWIPMACLPTALNISKEQGFRDALRPLGDFLALGRPGEWLQPLGAARVYPGNEWQQEVTRYLARARVVIVRPGSGPNILWEVEQVLKTVPPQRILFYLRFRGSGKRRQREYRVLRRCVRMHLGAELPERLGADPYLAFDAAGRPRFIREAARPSDWIRQVFSRSGDMETDRFRPVLQAVGLDAPLQPKTVLENVLHVLLWVSAVICVILTVAALALLIVLIVVFALSRLALALGA